MACVLGSNPAVPFDQLFSLVNGVTAGLNFRAGGVGIRDVDASTTASDIVLNMPAAPITAYIYLNTLQDNTFTVPKVQISVDAGAFTDVPVTLLAYCGNTCWLAVDNGSHGDGATTAQNIFNFVYWADITSIVLNGNHTYSIKVPGITNDAGIATNASDTPHYPGCAGGQGIEILAMYDDGSGILRNYRIFHGSKLLAPDAPNPIWPGGSTSYSVTFPSVAPYYFNPIVLAVCGDTQTKYSDSFCFNGVCATPNSFGSVWNGQDDNSTGNLLDEIQLDASTSILCANLSSDNNATISVAGTTECLCWFLFFYLAEDQTDQCDCDPGPTLGPGSLSNFKNMTGNIDYAIGGIGTRDIQININPGVFGVEVPGPPLEAYLYWNVIVDESVVADVARLNGTPYMGTMIGKVGNSCWGPPQGNGSNICIDCGIRNQVWRTDVSAQVLGDIPNGGIFTASVTIDNVGVPVEPVCTQASDTPHYPGCNGSQGVVLLVIYNSPCGGSKKLLVYDGAVLITGPDSQPVYGGTTSYTLNTASILPELAGCARITLAVGDAQTQYADSFLWNGGALPQNGFSSYANPDVGNLLWIGENQVVANPGVNTITGSSTFDCLCWFLFVCETYPPFECLENDCGPNACHGAAPFDTIPFFERLVGDIDFVLAGVGIRDFDTNITQAIINITIPGPVIKAYLYWNTIGGGNNCPNTIIVDDSDPLPGTIVGCCGNTCWSVYCTEDGSDHGDQTADNNLLNKVWFRDVTDLITGSDAYNFSIPDVHPDPTIAYAASDTPHFPGCCGGQGIALLVIYQTEPHIVTRPRKHCCVPVGTQTVTERETREILIWHGAKLLICNGCQPATIGGSNSYSISWKTKYTWKPKIATAVGDAQSQYADSFYWNGNQLPPQPSYFNPYAGNLLHVKTEYLPAHSAICNCGPNGQSNNVTAFTPDDCLCWFLFVYSGAIKCVTPIISSSQSFTSPPTPMMSLWNPNPPDCCPVKLSCCGDVCLPARLNIGITAATFECGCLSTQGYVMDWDKTQQKYILANQANICGCTLFGWLYCVGSQWTLYLALSSGEDLCSDGINTAFPITCSPFGGVGVVLFNPVSLCSCNCIIDALTISVSAG